MPSQTKKKKLNTGGAAAFTSLLNMVASNSSEQKKDAIPVGEGSTPEIKPAVQEIENQEAASVSYEVKHEIENKKVVNMEPIDIEVLEKPTVKEVEATKKNEILSSNEILETISYTKKENEIVKKFLSKRKSKGKTTPVLIDDSLKERLNNISNTFDVTVTSFVCNVLEEHFKEFKDNYIELANKKKPFSL